MDIDAARLSRARTGSFTPELAGEDDECINVPFAFPNCEPTTQTLQRDAWETGSHLKEEEFARAISLALLDYMRKSRLRGFVVSISGGADSAAVSCLVALMVRFAMTELGREDYLAKLRYFDDIQSAHDQREMVCRLLACVYQSTQHSGPVTLNAARGVAEAIGAVFFQFDVDRLVQDYVSMVSRAIGRELTWEHDDLALQNIQARARAPGVWLLANLRGALSAMKPVGRCQRSRSGHGTVHPS